MNKRFYILLVTTVVSTLLISCSNDDDAAAAVAQSLSKTTFKIGSVEKIFTEANSFNNGVLSLGNDENELIGLFFPIPSTFPKTYNMDTEDTLIATYTVGGKEYTATNGISGTGQKGSLRISITAYSDSRISGTFQFTAITEDNEEIIIKDGVFDKIPDLDLITN